jgi:hypothetical protein
MLLVMIWGASGTVWWRDNVVVRQVSGEIQKIQGTNQIVVKAADSDNLVIRVPSTAAVWKGKSPSRASSLEIGDKVRIRYISRPIGRPEAVKVNATIPTVKGRISKIDLGRETVYITTDREIYKFVVRDETVIMQNGSLARLDDLKWGSTAKAEYRNSLDPQLDFLLVND